MFRLVIPKTNFVAGEKIPASLIASNALDRERLLDWHSGDPCWAGIGEFLIVEERSGKRMDCVAPLDERAHVMSASLGPLLDHASQEFPAELLRGYTLTHAGAYSVQAAGKFRLLESPTTYVTLTTPPVITSLSPRIETNVVEKPGAPNVASTNHLPVR